MSLLKKIGHQYKLPILFSVGILLGVFGTILVSFGVENIETISGDHSIRQSGYKYINPLLECEIQNKVERQKYIPFEDIAIERINNEVINKNPNVKVGVYVRNLNNGPWFGINENEYYSPASILKVPIFITYLKWIEKDPTIWNKTMFSSIDTSYTHHFPPSQQLEINKEYSVSTLLEHMIRFSDNSAMYSLVKSIPTNLYTQINKDLGITVPGAKTPEDYLSVKDMATFFRILYNSSYLERESSEFALSMLTKTDFNKGLRSGVPNNIEIAHKFGERGYNDDKTGTYIRQLHDCGIVYYSSYPYLACIVTRGTDFDANAKIISDTSRIIFEEISKAFPQK